jgi:FHS family L-fucose permease-like MFS transporter
MAAQNQTAPASQEALLPPGIRLPFILLASCFMWWGIANNITDPLVRVFKAVFGD